MVFCHLFLHNRHIRTEVVSPYKQIIGTILHFPFSRQTLYSLESAKLVYKYVLSHWCEVNASLYIFD